MNCPVTLLCKNPAEDEGKRMEQALICAMIEGYTDATLDGSYKPTNIEIKYDELDITKPVMVWLKVKSA